MWKKWNDSTAPYYWPVVILRERNEMIQRLLVTGPYEENIANIVKLYQK